MLTNNKLLPAKKDTSVFTKCLHMSENRRQFKFPFHTNCTVANNLVVPIFLVSFRCSGWAGEVNDKIGTSALARDTAPQHINHSVTDANELNVELGPDLEVSQQQNITPH